VSAHHHQTAHDSRAAIGQSRHAAEQADEVAGSNHSITSSARASSVGGTSRPSALALTRLMVKSNSAGCMTGKSAAGSPFRILENKPALSDRKTERPSTSPRARKHPNARQSEFPVSRSGMNQESDHNKHNESGQSGHEPQRPTPAQEKQK
jgi:hypothetical protein